MNDYFICYIGTKGKVNWSKGRSFSKEDMKRTYSHMTYVQKVERVLTTIELLKELTQKEINL